MKSDGVDCLLVEAPLVITEVRTCRASEGHGISCHNSHKGRSDQRSRPNPRPFRTDISHALSAGHLLNESDEHTSGEQGAPWYRYARRPFVDVRARRQVSDGESGTRVYC
jgi:hypothetical protein